MKYIFLILIIFISNFFSSQTDIHFQDEKDKRDFNDFNQLHQVKLNFTEDQLENLIFDSLELPEVKTFGKINFNNQLDKNYFYWLKKKAFRVYPYYLEALNQYNNIQDSLQRFGKSKAVKKLIAKRQETLANQYEERLKNLTKKEGQIFSKLMHRETGKTTYEIIKEFRGGWSAFWWNAKAQAFSIDLDEGFHPDSVREDYFIEVIIRQGIKKGELSEAK